MLNALCSRCTPVLSPMARTSPCQHDEERLLTEAARVKPYNFLFIMGRSMYISSAQTQSLLSLCPGGLQACKQALIEGATGSKRQEGASAQHPDSQGIPPGRGHAFGSCS